MRDDTDEIIRRLEGDPEAILNRYWRQWIKVGSKALLTPRQKEKQKKPTSSFVLNLAGQHKNQWYRFSAGVGGGLIALIYYSEKGSVPDSKGEWAEAFKLAREFLGMEPQRELSEEEKRDRDFRREQDQQQRAAREKADAEEQARKDAERILSAKQVWQQTLPLPGSHAEAYLIARGLPPVNEWPWDCSKVLRFHPGLASEMEPRAGRFPALIAKVQDAFGDAVAVWQEFLNPNTPEKAPLDNPKVGRGPAGGGAIRIGGDAERIGMAEGVVTSIGFWALEGYRKPIWATTSTSGMRAFEPPIFVKHVSIYFDGDKGLLKDTKISEPPGIEAGRALHRRMKAVGVGCNIDQMPLLLGDGLDLWNTRREHEKK